VSQRIAYAPAVQSLLAGNRVFELGPGQPDAAGGTKLRALSLEDLFAPEHIYNPVSARACLAGLWLYFDFLDESHSISQDIASVEGSYWHGIMHRREPDYGNAKYWFRRVGRHPVFETLSVRAVELVEAAGRPAGSERLTRGTGWDPFAFVDLCEAVARGQADCDLLCRHIQRAEWDLLFDHCYRRAIWQQE
jgi:hypothetical protein